MLVVLAVSCLVFWIAIPAGTLWALGHATDDPGVHFVAGLLGVPLAMVAFSPVLLMLNRLYLRVTGVLARLEEDESEADWRRRVRGPLEPMLAVSFVAAAAVICVWFFTAAGNPTRSFW